MALQPLVSVIFLTVLLSYCFFFLRYTKSKTTGFKNYPLLGTIPEFILNGHRLLDWTTEVLSQCPTNTAVMRFRNVKEFITANPANVEHMLKTNFENYPKGTHSISILEDFLGRGIFNSDGEMWRDQRKTASYEFNTRTLRTFMIETAVVELNTRFIPILERAANLNRVIDLQDLFERFAFDNICRVAFNAHPCCLAGDGTSNSEFMKAFEEASTLSNRRFFYVYPELYKIMKLLNIGSESNLKKSIIIVHKFANDIIRSRMEEKAAKTDDDLLSRFVGKSEYSPEFLRDIVISFILAGRDTTSSSLTWFFWLLSSHPKVEQKILEELKAIRQRSGGSRQDFYSFDEVRQMHYLHAAISEGLRLYPPVPVNSKDCLKDNVMPDGTFIGKGSFVTYNSYAMGRMESVWGKDCCEFRPERWLEEEEGGGGNVVYRPESPFKFPVFHGGPRICLGKEMAYTQMKLVATRIIELFEVEVVEEMKNPPDYLLSLTMRMKDGLRVRVRKRRTKSNLSG